MKRYLWSLIILLLLAMPGFSQPSPEKAGRTNPDRLLNPQELRNEKLYEDLDEALANPDKVYKLSLADQGLKSLPVEIGTLTHLQVLNLSGNKLKTLPAEIGDLNNLQLLSLFHNRLKYIPLEFREMDNLRALYLGRNKLSEMPIWMGGLGKLRRLDVSRNRMTPLEVSYIKNLMPRVELTY